MKKCAVSFIFTFIISVSLNLCDGSRNCSAAENNKWNAKRSQCVKCENCQAGYFRNLTEQYIGPTVVYGDTRCLLCRECPSGTFSENGRGECRQCQNCTDLNREYGVVCTNRQNAHCGSCISGFYDIYGDTKLPCGRKESNEERKTVRIEEELQHNDQLIDSKGKHLEVVSQDALPLSTLGILIIALSSVVVIVVVVGGAVAYWKPSFLKRQRRVQLIHTFESDIEVDGDKESTERKDLSKTSGLVHAEMQSGRVFRPVRGELSHPDTRDLSTNIVYFRMLESLGSNIVCYRPSKKICSCESVRRCKCRELISRCRNIVVSKSDSYILTVARMVCHDPKSLFVKLGLGSAVIYQENDSRDRDPEKITEKELVTNLLNIWTQIQAEPQLNVLLEALCTAKFHTICAEICRSVLSVQTVDENNEESACLYDPSIR